MKIAISGFTGTGKTSVAKKLYEHLKDEMEIELLAPTFKDVIESLGITLEEYERKAEEDHSIDRKFDEKIREMFSSQGNAILASWLAIWLVEADMKVFLHAPLEVRAQRMAEREGLSMEEAIEYIEERDARNRKRYMEVYNIDIDKFYELADISINTASFSIDEEVSLILKALNHRKD
ncbi:MAG: cytidylate kinase [Methanobacteriota archaeon]|nr:MAG: cytidylate kinase [Euryarchaeota archaeon]